MDKDLDISKLSRLPTDERIIVVQGKKTIVKRRDVQTQINDIIKNTTVDPDTAWEMVVFYLEAHLSGTSLPINWMKSWISVNRPLLSSNEIPLIISNDAKSINNVIDVTPYDGTQNAIQAPYYDNKQTIDDAAIETTDQFLFPNISPSKRFLPKLLMRTSLFHAGANNSSRKHYVRQPLAVLGGGRFSLNYTGPEFRRPHEMVFMEILKHSKGKRPGELIAINIYQFAQGCYPNRAVGKNDVDLIDAIADELHSGTFIFSNEILNIEFKARILDKYDKDGTTRYIRLDVAASPMYLTYTAFDYQMSQSLGDIAWQVGKYILSLPSEVINIYPIKEVNFFEHCYGTIASQIEHQLKLPKKVGMMTTSDQAKKAVMKKFSHFKKNTLPAALDDLKNAQIIISYTQEDGKIQITKSGKNINVIAQ